MANPVASLLSMHKCNRPDAEGMHVEIPVFFTCNAKVKVLNVNAAVQGDMIFCFHRIPTPVGPVVIPTSNPVQKGFLKVKFGGKPATREKDRMANRWEIFKGSPLLKIG